LVGGNVVFIQRKVVVSVEGFDFSRIVTLQQRTNWRFSAKPSSLWR
jgi:hypothetical protein